jgi:hypothetical protein
MVHRELLNLFDGKHLCATMEEKTCVSGGEFASQGGTADRDCLR